MSKRKMILAVLGTGLLVLPLTAGNCDGGGGNDCTSEADCTVDEHCHPTLNVCVSNCKQVEGACDTETGTTCSETDIIEPIGGLAFNGICVCDPADDQCPEGESCNPYDRTCDVPCAADADCSEYGQSRVCRDSFCQLPLDDCRNDTTVCGEQVCDPATGNCIDACTDSSTCGTQVCNTSTGLCVDACTAGSCTTGYCDDSRFGDTGLCLANPTSCDNDTCVTSSSLCDADANAETHNLCIDPDDATNTCGADGTMDANGPIMYIDDPSADIWEADSSEDTGNCLNNGNTLMAVMFVVDGGIASSEYSNTYWQDPDGGSWANTTYYTEQASSGGFDFLTVYMCFNSSGPNTRAFYHDNGTGESNRVCVEFDY